jgi:NAD(P)-dependent dehydrogenase (short-subunit alcohol dehydrogenase family)
MDVSLHESLDGQVALVTGADRGIGAVIADELLDHDAVVYAGVRDTGTVDGDRERLCPFEPDVIDDGQIDAAVDRIDAEAGRLDVLVNNAGVYGPRGPLHEVDTDGIDETFDVNLRGPTVLTKRALPLLLEREAPRVVNVLSRSGQLSSGTETGRGPYSASKAGLNGLTVYLDAEYGARKLLANAVCPGWVRTAMGGSGAPRTPGEGAETPVWLARFAPGAPSGAFWADRERIEW